MLTPMGSRSIRYGIGTSYVPASNRLLDNVSGLLFAFGFNRMLTSYTGNAVRLYKSFPSTEYADYGFLADDEWDQASAVTYFSGVHAGVGIWYDQSPNALQASQLATAGEQPRVITSAGVVNTIGGKAAIKFDGTDDWLDVGKPNALDVSEWLIFLVWQTGTLTGQVLSNFDAAGNYARHDHRVSGSGVMFADARGAYWQSNNTRSTNTAYISSLCLSSSAAKLYSNGSLDRSVSVSGSVLAWSSVGNFTFGRSTSIYDKYPGLLACAIGTTSLDIATHNHIGAGLAARYGVAWTTVT